METSDQVQERIERPHRLFLKSIERLKADLYIVSNHTDFLAKGSKSGASFRKRAWFRLIVQTVLSFILLAAGLYLLISHEYGDDLKKIGSGFIGTVVGYWLA